MLPLFVHCGSVVYMFSLLAFTVYLVFGMFTVHLLNSEANQLEFVLGAAHQLLNSPNECGRGMLASGTFEWV